MAPPVPGTVLTEEVARPFLIVSPEMASVDTNVVPMLKTRLALLPLTASVAAPGPVIVMLLLIASSPAVRVMVPDKVGAN